MKTIDVKSMLIGFLLCAVGFLFIGATENDENVNYRGSWDLIKHTHSPLHIIERNHGRVFKWFSENKAFIEEDILTIEEAREKFKKDE